MTPYELATLAARLDPKCCSSSTRLKEAIDSAIALYKLSWHELEHRNSSETLIRDTIASQTAWLEEFGIPQKFAYLRDSVVAYKLGIYAITGIERGKFSRADARFSTLVKHVISNSPTRPERGELEHLLKQYKENGFTIDELVSWRLEAEESGKCKKKLLTEFSSSHVPKPTKLEKHGDQQKRLSARTLRTTARLRKRPAKSD